MPTIWMEFRNGGWPNWIILLLGLVGIGVTLVALALTAGRTPISRWVGIVAVVLAAVISGAGVLGVLAGHTATNRALASGAIHPTQVERIRREGYKESKSCAEFGLAFALLPLLAGAIGIFAAPRRVVRPATAPNPYAMQPEPTAGDAEGSGWGVGVAALLMAGLAVASDIALVAQPLPGREISYRESEILDAKDLLDEGSMHEGCLSLEHALHDGAGGAAAGVDDVSMSATCADSRLDEILKESPALRRSDLASFATSPLLDAAHKQRVQDEMAKLQSAPSPSGVAGAMGSQPIVNGRLPPEIIQRIVRQHFGQMKRCYEHALATNPTLSGRVVVRFVIARDGSVATAADGGSDLTDKTVRDCVVAAFQNISFPAPEGGIVTVTYPIVFNPG
jgi:hypothetical protein